jgi:4a-hydroxytetrahydrobiopterin dehydratase
LISINKAIALRKVNDLDKNKKDMWKEENNQLQKTFQFENFVEAFAFMTQVAFAAEKMDHHPNWSNVYNKVEIRLFTHDANNSITEKDRKLSVLIDEIYKK